MPEYHGPEGERFTREELAREAARPVAARVQGLMGVILSRQAIAQDATQELAARQAREQAEQGAQERAKEAEAAEKTATRVALQKATTAYMRSEAQAVAQYMVAHGIPPTVTIAKDSKKPAELCWVLGVLRTRTADRELVYAPGVFSEGGGRDTRVAIGTKPAITNQLYRGIGLLPSGELVHINDLFAYKNLRPALGATIEVSRLGDGVVTDDILAPPTRMHLEDMPQNQDIAVSFRHQLESLAAYGRLGAMQDYLPHWNTITIEPFSERADLDPITVGSIF